MADIELVIKIDENIYRRITSGFAYGSDVFLFADLFKKGVILPKNHGDLVDRNSFEYLKTCHDVQWDGLDLCRAIKKIKNSAPTIIERSKDGSD